MLFLWSSICIPNFFVHGSVIQLFVMDLCTKKLGMQIELHRNNVYQGVELLLLVSMLFLLAIPKCLLIFKEIFITLVLIILVLPTEFLRAPSARRGTPMDLRRVRGHTYRREGRISWRRWQSNTYSVRTRTKFVSPCINIPQCRHFVTFARAFAALSIDSREQGWATPDFTPC